MLYVITTENAFAWVNMLPKCVNVYIAIASKSTHRQMLEVTYLFVSLLDMDIASNEAAIAEQ